MEWRNSGLFDDRIRLRLVLPVGTNMPQPCRIGSQIGSDNPFWVQIREIVNQRAQQLGPYLIPIEIAGRLDTLPIDEQIGVVEELLAEQLDALICWNFIHHDWKSFTTTIKVHLQNHGVGVL